MKKFLWSCLFCTLLTIGLASAEPSLEAMETVKEPTVAYGRALEVSRETMRLREARDLDGLEALAAQLRTSRERLDGGTWLLSIFYECASSLPSEEPGIGEAIAFFEQWAKDRPQSITAQVCLGDALVSYAWEARGSGWASTVSPEGWRLMNERLDRAEVVLGKARDLKEKCPGWTSAAQSLALGQGWDRKVYMDMVASALEQEPTYGRYITDTCYWLLPRWYGEEGDFEKWLHEMAEAHPEAGRDRYYAFLVWMADRMRVSGEIVFAPGRLDWGKTKKGFEEWLVEKPDNLMVRLEYIRMALLANDRDTVRKQFTVTGPKYFPEMWRNPQQFRSAWEYGFKNGRNPLTRLPANAGSRDGRKLSPEALARVDFIVRLILGGSGGLLAGVLLLILAIQRNVLGVGIAALALSVVAGLLGGTIASTVVAAGLWLYFRRRPPQDWPEKNPSPWFTLMGLVGLVGCYLGLQIVAVVVAIAPLYFDPTVKGVEGITRAVMENGSAFQIVISSAWLSFLLLLTICQPRTLESWKARLGLYVPSLAGALPWMIGGGVVIALLAWLSSLHSDETTREAVEMIRLGVNSPILFFLTVGLIAPLIEELIFRGYAYSGWIGRLGFWWTALASSLAFALVHLQYGWVGLLYTFFVGFTLSVVRWRTGSIYPPMLLHVLVNLSFCGSSLFAETV